jgi:hypothetical protein
MYGLGVGISTVFEIAEHFLFNGWGGLRGWVGWNHPIWS